MEHLCVGPGDAGLVPWSPISAQVTPAGGAQQGSWKAERLEQGLPRVLLRPRKHTQWRAALVRVGLEQRSCSPITPSTLSVLLPCPPTPAAGKPGQGARASPDSNSCHQGISIMVAPAADPWYAVVLLAARSGWRTAYGLHR